MEIVSFEIAQKSKEKGFNAECYGHYFNGEFYPDMPPKYYQRDKYVSAPFISQVLKWLREEKKIHIVIDIWGRTWGYDVLSLPSGNSQHWTAYEENIKSYEQAALAGIEYVLDNNLI